MVDDGEITGIIDWETLGWYPDFWELMIATKGSGLSYKWMTELSLVFGQQPHSSSQYERVLFDVFFRQWTSSSFLYAHNILKHHRDIPSRITELLKRFHVLDFNRASFTLRRFAIRIWPLDRS
jgi:hypothetical protein